MATWNPIRYCTRISTAKWLVKSLTGVRYWGSISKIGENRGQPPIYLFQFLFPRPAHRQGTQTLAEQGFQFCRGRSSPQWATNMGGGAGERAFHRLPEVARSVATPAADRWRASQADPAGRSHRINPDARRHWTGPLFGARYQSRHARDCVRHSATRPRHALRPARRRKNDFARDGRSGGGRRATVACSGNGSSRSRARPISLRGVTTRCVWLGIKQYPYTWLFQRTATRVSLCGRVVAWEKKIIGNRLFAWASCK